jgi:hypothetical protein
MSVKNCATAALLGVGVIATGASSNTTTPIDPATLIGISGPLCVSPPGIR